ncbi:MAG: haloacid dehalogenase-like hydrolase [Solobacterium sp.]|nr:haloacid dehalogenase-like hydrolase [Solobacterium sp.]
MEDVKQLKIWKTIALISLSLLIALGGLYLAKFSKNTQDIATTTPEASIEPQVSETPMPEEEISYLSLWTEDAPARVALEDFMKKITDENASTFVPMENRIAVFDLDGTLFCETDPVYFDHMLFMHRVLEDPDYKDKATPFQLEVADKVQHFIDTGEYLPGLDDEHGQGVASAFAGMTVKEFTAYINDFKSQPAPGYNNMKRGDAFYLPMLEIIDFLQANGFKVYIVSGTDRFIVRGIADGLSFLDIPNNQIIGSDELLVSREQGDTIGLDYTYNGEDDLILAGQFLLKNLKMNKVTVIAQEIGIQPILSFGNSTGDSSMANYVIHNNPYPSLAFMLCCDDTVRENGNVEKAQKMFDLCAENGWIPVSMKNDWTTIYGDEVTRKQAN